YLIDTPACTSGPTPHAGVSNLAALEALPPHQRPRQSMRALDTHCRNRKVHQALPVRPRASQHLLQIEPFSRGWRLTGQHLPIDTRHRNNSPEVQCPASVSLAMAFFRLTSAIVYV